MHQPTGPDPGAVGDLGATGPGGRVAPSGGDLERQMDRLSLAQALRDVETANDRVVELTRQLVEADEKIRLLEERLESSRFSAVVFRRPWAALKASSLGRAARRARNALRSQAE